MATHKSSEKRARQDIRKNNRNSTAKSKVRTWEKKLRAAISTQDAKAAQDLMKSFESTISKAAQKGIVHAKAASRTVGRLAKQVSALRK